MKVEILLKKIYKYLLKASNWTLLAIVTEQFYLCTYVSSVTVILQYKCCKLITEW